MQRSAGGYIFLQHPWTLYVLYMFIGYINGFFHKNYMIEDVLLPLIVIIVDDFLFNTIIYIVSFLLKNKTNYGVYLLHVICRRFYVPLC